MAEATVSRRPTDQVGGDHAGQPSDVAVHPNVTGPLPMLDSTWQLSCEQATLV